MPKRDRYWSVMLVGDSGRVIPFRHFKALAIGGCCAFILMLLAFIVMAIMFTHQTRKISNLQSQVTQAEQEKSKLRDEKDLYLTKLMLYENKKPENQEKAPSPPAEEASVKPDKIRTKPAVPKETENKSLPSSALNETHRSSDDRPVEKQSPAVQWKADIRQFTANYNRKTKILKAQFRIYNRSRPKRPLVGRSVVIFKKIDDPPPQWLAMPRVALKKGQPPVDQGQTFQIRNYKTMKFKAYGLKAPKQFNTATAYVFSNEGQVLAKKGFAVNIDVLPPDHQKRVLTPAVKAPDAPTSPEPTQKLAPVQAPREGTTLPDRDNVISDKNLTTVPKDGKKGPIQSSGNPQESDASKGPQSIEHYPNSIDPAQQHAPSNQNGVTPPPTSTEIVPKPQE